MMRNAITKLLLLGLALFASFHRTAAQEPKVDLGSSSDFNAKLKEAEVDYRTGAIDHAIAKYSEILKVDPLSVQAYAGMTRCYLKQDKIREAAATIEKGLELKSADPELKVARAEVFFRQGRIA